MPTFCLRKPHAFSQTERHQCRLATSVILLATQSIQPLQRTRQLRPLNAQPESAVFALLFFIQSHGFYSNL